MTQPYPGPFAALLFDMDGTLLTSIAAAERVWGRWAMRHGLDVAAFLPTIHGKRAIETIRAAGVAGIDPAAEARWVTEHEIADTGGIEPIAGAAAFLAALPSDRWAIVTSAPRLLAERRLAAAGLVPPPVVVTADDITHGKPAPDCFLDAAGRLGVDPARCLVFEDAPAGIAAGEAAGCAVVVVTATHAHPLATPHPTIPDYRGVAAVVDADGAIRIKPATA